MCLAVPARVIETDGRQALVEVLGNRRRIDVGLVEAAVGEYVLVHAGTAIEVLDEEEAAATMAAFQQVMGNA